MTALMQEPFFPPELKALYNGITEATQYQACEATKHVLKLQF